MYAYICTLSRKFLRHYTSVALNTSEPSNSKKQTLVTNYSILLHVLQDLAMLDLCSEGA